MDALLLGRIARVIVALILIAAGVSKAFRLRRFQSALVSSRLLSAPGAAIAMLGVPIAEIALGAWLLLSMDSQFAAWASVALLLIFTAYIVLLRALKRDVACGCFKLAGRVSDPALGRNFGLIALVAAGTNQALAPVLLGTGLLLLAYWKLAVMRRRRPAARVAADA